MIDAIRETLARWRSLLRKKSADRELSDEIAAHLELIEEEHRKRGFPVSEARRQALLQFGGVEAAKELHREARGMPWVESLAQDLRYTFRTLKRDLGFTLFAILIAGLGIGGSTVVFSVVHTLLVRPLPFHDPNRLVWIANGGIGGLSGETVQVNHFLDLRAQNRSLSDIAGYFAFYGLGDSKLIRQGEPERLSTLPVTQNFFPLLGVQPQMGRLFTTEECKWRGPRAVLLSHTLWKRRFASDPKMVGRVLTMDDGPVTVIGVLPASFDFGSVFAPGTRIDLYAPFPLSEETNRWGNTLALIGRLKPGVNVARARSEVNGLSRQLEKAHRRERNEFDARLMPLAEHVSGRWRAPLLVLVCAVAVVMLIVCANLSNLLLARTATRQKELAVRTALGAGRQRLIRQLLTENVVLASLGAVFGLVLAVAGARVLSRLGAMGIPLLDSVGIDGLSLVFALLLTLATGILFGLIPALQVRDVNINNTLKESSRSASEGRQHGWIRKSLVISEIAFASMLLIATGLLVRSFLRVLDVRLGFQPESAATMRIDPSSGYSTQAQRNSYFTEALRRVREIPGIRAAALTDALPLGRNRSWGVGVKGKQYERGQYPEAFPRVISDGYLRSMGVPLIAGREFTERDLPSSEPVILINRTMAQTIWPGEEALGKIIDADRERRVVGIVGDVRHLALEQGSGNEMYLPIRQTSDYQSVDLIVRASLPPTVLASSIRSALRALDPNLPGNDFRPLQALVDKAVSPRRFFVILLSGFSLFALILASLGIYAVISYSVTQRTQEIGIRMALGATGGIVQKNILQGTLTLVAYGLLLGMGLSVLLAQALRSLLYGVTAGDPLTFASMLAVLIVVAVLAGYIPAYRASRIDPMRALRVG